jgi:hypothetical protein
MEAAGAIFIRLWVTGPLLYVGLLLIIDPIGVVKSLEILTNALRTLEDRLRGVMWQVREPDPLKISPSARIAVQLAGLTLTTAAFLTLAGFLN